MKIGLCLKIVIIYENQRGYGFFAKPEDFQTHLFGRSLKHLNKLALEELTMEKREFWHKDDHVVLA